MSPTRVYYLMKGATWLCFMTAFSLGAIYRIRWADLGPLELVLVGTALELAIFLCEIPTGVVADVRGRKLSMVLGFVVLGSGFVLEVSWPSFGMSLVAQVVVGVGFTLISGAEDAWLADEIGEERLASVMQRGNQIQQGASLLGIAVAVVCTGVSLRLPFVVAGVGLVVLALWLLRVMPEEGFVPKPASERETWGDLAETLAQGLRTTRRRPLLGTLMLITLCYGLSSEGLDRLWEAHLIGSFTLPSVGLSDVMWIGGIHAVAMLGTLGLSEVLRRRADAFGHRAMVLLLTIESVVMVLGLVAFALTGRFAVAVAAYLVVYVVRHCGQPLRIAWINRGLESRVRATVLSTVNQMDAFGQLAGGPLVGGVGNLLGLRAALVAVAGLLTPVWGLYARALGQGPETQSEGDE